MKKIHLMFIAVTVIIGFTACNSKEKELAIQEADNLTLYVDSVDKASTVYTAANWTEIDNGYQERAIKAEARIDQLEAADKARAEESKAKFASIKAKLNF